MRLTLLLFLAAAALFMGAGFTGAQDAKKTEHGLSVYKLGEINANDKQAGEVIDKLAKYLTDKVGAGTFLRRGVRNKPEEALELIKGEKEKTTIAIVSPGFYFKNKDTLKLSALAEARRGGFDGEQYTLVGRTKADKYPEGKRIGTSLDADVDWLNKVVLPAPAGAKPVQWVHFDNLADAGYLYADEPEAAPDFILLDRVSLKVFQSDPDLKGLVQGIQSEVVPQDLVVEVDGRLGEKREALKKVLSELDKSDEGKKLGELLQTATFPAVNEKRLEVTSAKYK